LKEAVDRGGNRAAKKNKIRKGKKGKKKKK
jgi:hypothetical protein